MTRSAPLVAVTRSLDFDVDHVAFAGPDGTLFSRSGIGFAGCGVAIRGPRDAVVGELSGMAVDNPLALPGTGPVALGALPFMSGEGAELVVPSLLVGTDEDGNRWATAVGPSPENGAPPADPERQVQDRIHAVAEGPRPIGPGAFTVSAQRSPGEWMQVVANAVARIKAGELEKVVLARAVTVSADAPIPIQSILARLARSYPDCFLYLVDGFCGASPELLVSRSGDVVRAQPMAGTAPRAGEPEADDRAAAALLASAGYRHEHQVTIDAVHDTLLQFSSYVDYEPEPSVVALSNVVHLATNVEGRLSHPPASILELVDALHPTPAVCGRPTAEALRLIEEVEGFDRGRYAGAVGWVDAAGNGAFAVSIRGASVSGNQAVIVGGNGIVADSDPATELVETRAKMQAMLSAMVRP